MNKKSLEELFLSAENPDFCIVIIEKRGDFGFKYTSETLARDITVCKNFLEASLLTFFVTYDHDRIICHLNYDSESFSIRAFIGSLRQVLFTVGNKNHSYVFYSRNCKSRDELDSELNFLFANSAIEILLGTSRPIPSDYLHMCAESTVKPYFINIKDASDMLKKGRFENVREAISLSCDVFRQNYDASNAFPLTAMLEHVSDIYYLLKLFYIEKNYSFDLFGRSIYENLFLYNGISGLLDKLASTILDYTSSFQNVSVSEKKQRHIIEMLEYIEDNIATVSLSDLSARFGLTPEYICRLFKNEYSTNFTDYVKKKRFEIAVSFLQRDLDITISELCEKIGYQSRSYFQKIFKDEYGMTPDAYRKQYNKNRH